MRTLTIALATWREAIRQPVSIIILCIAAAMVFLSPTLSIYHLDEEAKYNAIRQMSVAQTLMCGIVIAVFTASAVLAEEIENRTVLTLLAKPVRRHEVVVGKFLGILLAIGAAFAVLVLASLYTVWWAEVERRVEKNRANPGFVVTKVPALATGQGTWAVADAYREYVRRPRPTELDYLHSLGDFLLLASGQSSALVARVPLGAPVQEGERKTAVCPGLGALTEDLLRFLRSGTGVLGPAFLLSFAQVMVIAAISVAVSTRLPLVFNALFCAAMFIIGNVSFRLADALREADGTPFLKVLTWPLVAVLYLLPNFRNFDLTEVLSVGRETVPFGAWALGVLYGIAYSIIILAVAALLFRRREVA